jgi:hypothetical protein
MSRFDELIAQWTEEVEAEAAVLMEHDGMSPDEAGACARTTVNARRKQAAEDRKASAEAHASATEGRR